MEGFIARWYTKTRGTASQVADWRRQATELTRGLPDGASLLEVAPGPGFFSVELARLGRFRVTGLDISHTFVEIARSNARAANVTVDFRQGDAARMPFPDASFDLVVCQAAFKNFTRPQKAIDEMFRVLKPGGTAHIQDMRKDADAAAVRAEVESMHLGAGRAFLTRRALLGLRRRAYTLAEFDRMGKESRFRGCAIHAAGIGVDVEFRR
jgi:ubiquinone/menaquinone biosynthesis C-methylase UbiE